MLPATTPEQGQQDPAPPPEQGQQAPGFFFRSNPLDLLKQDVRLIFKNASYLPNMLYAYSPTRLLPSAELAIFQNPKNLFAILSQVVLFLASVIAVNGTFVLVGLGLPALVVGGWIGGWVFAFWLEKKLNQGGGKEPGVIRPSKHKDWEKEKSRGDETWLFCNGVCTNRIWAQANVDLLSEIFKRNVVGIHNQTNGFFFDIVECMLQREWGYGTQDAVPLLYKKTKDALLNSDTKKVVVIAHSQGGIILSLVVDWLLADLPESALRKLEIYTFASAATHFNSPRGSNGEHQITTVEHFANSFDPVARIGVLQWWKPHSGHSGQDQDRFYGKLFVRDKISGHLLNQHYLQSLTPQNNGWPKDEQSKLWSYVGGN
ncbi:hypothetical protein BDY24DRAFT_378786 [Mrakia frigida]|uniref:uncharacterized protein n=1 Tax=Mrakia frigida TaxID=29902 RepID=UPI003FCC22CD